MRRTLGFVVLCATACHPGDADDDTDDPAGGTCDVRVLSALPPDEAEEVYFGTDVVYRLSEADPTATITVVEQASGALVPGTSVVTDTSVTWSGDAPFEPNTGYVSTLTYTCGEEIDRWSTSGAGGPVQDPYSLRNNVYSVDLTEGRWVQPYGIGPIMNALLVGVEILVSPTDVSTTIDMRGALGDGNGNQDLCEPSVEFPQAAFEDPSFSVETPRLDLSVGDTAAGIDDFTLTGSFAPDGSTLEGVTVGGSIDTRALVPLIDGSSDAAFCQEIDVTLHVSCEECADQSGPYCLALLIDSITAEQVGSQGLDIRTAGQIQSDGNCNSR
jgi:hypothetical protein